METIIEYLGTVITGQPFTDFLIGLVLAFGFTVLALCALLIIDRFNK